MMIHMYIFWSRLKTLAFVADILLLSFTCIRKTTTVRLRFFSSSYNKIYFDVLVRGKMNGKEADEGRTGDVNIAPASRNAEQQKIIVDPTNVVVENPKTKTLDTKKQGALKSFTNFLYDPRNKTVLGRSSLNWGKFCNLQTIMKFSFQSFS